MARVYSVYGLETLPLIKEGTDLAKLIVEASEKEKVGIDDGDILVVGHKIVSKAEGRVIQTSKIKPRKKAVELAFKHGRTPGFVEGILREAREILSVWDQTFIVKDWRGWVCVNAGIDISNVSRGDSFLMLPENPDASADSIRKGIQNLTGKSVGVVITDTYSRPLRRGMVDFTVGLAGVKVFEDYRGKHDLFGKILKSKFVARADELAAAAELVLGQGDEGVPVAVVKGLASLLSDDHSGSNELIMDREEDMYSGVV
jgi:coenzyme F420-0:L-glutamate ligase/coenzyme F420-1:gamma-L-glutamate ligase